MDGWAQLFHHVNIQMWHNGYVKSSMSKSLLIINNGPTHTHTFTDVKLHCGRSHLFTRL